MSDSALKPFCDNKRCLYHNAEAPDDEIEINLVGFDGVSEASITRAAMSFPNGQSIWVCECCQNIIKMVLNPDMKVTGNNPSAFMPK